MSESHVFCGIFGCSNCTLGSILEIGAYSRGAVSYVVFDTYLLQRQILRRRYQISRRCPGAAFLILRSELPNLKSLLLGRTDRPALGKIRDAAIVGHIVARRGFLLGCDRADGYVGPIAVVPPQTVVRAYAIWSISAHRAEFCGRENGVEDTGSIGPRGNHGMRPVLRKGHAAQLLSRGKLMYRRPIRRLRSGRNENAPTRKISTGNYLRRRWSSGATETKHRRIQFCIDPRRRARFLASLNSISD